MVRAAAMLIAVLCSIGTVAALRSPLAAEEGGAAGSATAPALSGALPQGLGEVLAVYLNGATGLGIPTTFLHGDVPRRAVTVGDANGDGNLDLAVSEAGSGKVWILLGDGAGGFGLPTRIPAGSRQTVVAVGDFNGDGIDDQAVAEQFSAGVRLLLGDGTGGFRAIESPGDARLGAALVADFNGDGNADLAVVDGVAPDVSIFLGDGRGGLSSATKISVGWAPTAIATGDFNGDGLPDLAVANGGSDSVSILLGDGAGGFAAAGSFTAGSAPTAIVVGDFNGDGVADVAVASSGSDSVSVLPGDGRGGLGAPLTIVVNGSGNDDPIAAADSSGSGPGYVGPTVLALTLNPATIAGGSGATSLATVTLGTPAPPGGRLITLSSSSTDLAASVPSVTVPEGATSATFTVGTNALYRRYSGLGFTVTISATNPGNGSTRSATLTVTAQPRPGGFPSDSSQRSGRMCGGAFPATQGERGILFDCSLAPNFGTTGTCTFRQECTLGCQTRPAQSFTGFKDVCALTPPFPIALSPKYLVGGNSSAGTILFSATSQPVPFDFEALVSNNNSFANVLPSGFFPVPVGASSVGFTVSTTPVAVPNFAAIGVNAVTPEALEGGSIFESHRTALTWLAFVPPPGAPPPAIATLTLTPSSVAGGSPSQATVTLTAPAPAGGADVRLGTDRPDVTRVPFNVVVPEGQTSATFTVTTNTVTTSIPVTISAAYGGIIARAVLTVTGAPPPITINSLFFTPSSVVGGTSSQGRVTLTSPVSSPAVVTLSNSNPAVVTVPTTVTVPAGNFAANFTATTNAVSATTTATITGSFGGVTQSAALTVTTAPALSAVTLNPTSLVGGNTSQGTVTLTAPAPTGGAVVSLSSGNTAVASVPTTGSVTVPAGATSATFTVTTQPVTASTSVTISATFAGVTRTAILTVTPASGAPLPAPTLLSPANDARFAPGQAITFDWTDVTGAASYTIQIDDSNTFTTPLIVSQTVVSQYTNSTLPTTRMWWRVRANDSAGNPGAWSAVRRVEVKN